MLSMQLRLIVTVTLGALSRQELTRIVHRKQSFLIWNDAIVDATMSFPPRTQ